jgi:hypothetical protein
MIYYLTLPSLVSLICKNYIMTSLAHPKRIVNYKPYTLKEYEAQMDQIRNQKRLSLGPDLNSAEYQEKVALIEYSSDAF